MISLPASFSARHPSRTQMFLWQQHSLYKGNGPSDDKHRFFRNSTMASCKEKNDLSQEIKSLVVHVSVMI